MKRYILFYINIFFVTALFGQATITNSINKSGLDLLQFLNTDTDQNINISPVSIHRAILIPFLGAKAETKTALNRIIYVSDIKNLAKQYPLLLQTIQRDINESCKIMIAEKMWIASQLKTQSAFIKDCEEINTNIDSVNFTNKPDKIAKHINQWVSDNTNNNIEQIIDVKDIDPNTRLIITNVTYFLGSWAKPFAEVNAVSNNFITNLSDSVSCTFLSKNLEINMFENDEMQLIDIPYAGNTFSMMLLLPKKMDSNPITNLVMDSLLAWQQNFKLQHVKVQIPKFKIETDLNLKDIYMKMGIINPFGSEADFSGITKDEAIFISALLHKSTISVSENGTEASAATAVIMGRSVSFNVKNEFTANHPFAYFVKHIQTGTFLFAGVVNNPVK